MARIEKIIRLTNEEKGVLNEAKEILKEISEGLEEDCITEYNNSEYITDILDIYFCYQERGGKIPPFYFLKST